MTQYTHVLYHKACPDGFGAAWAAWRALGEKAVYIPVAYKEPMPELPRNAKVLMVDFCYPRADCLKLKESVASLQVLDHHQSAAEEMRDVVWTAFDLTHSGAFLSWVHFHGLGRYRGEKVPEFVLYLEDRDLWTFKLPSSQEVAVAVASYPYDFLVWNGLLERGMKSLIQEGIAILRYQNQKIEEMCGRVVWKEFDGHKVPVVNATTMFSEVANRLCESYPDVPFAAYYFDRADGKRQWGLRSPGRFDVTSIAKKRGGGGHPGAAGFVEEIEKCSG